MKHTSHTLFYALCALLLWQACHSDVAPQKKVPSRPAAIHFVADSTELSYGRCDTTSMGPCAHVRLIHLWAEGTPQTVAQRINDTLAIYQATPLFDTMISSRNAQLHANAFIQQYQQYAQNDETWEYESITTYNYETDKVWSVSIRTYSYTGGAHPNSYVSLLAFAKKDGHKLQWEDILLDQQQFASLVEQHFRQARQLAPQANLLKGGFFWDGPFVLPQNFYVHPEGLHLVYNPYEIAPYVFGPTNLFIDRAKLEGLVRTELLW